MSSMLTENAIAKLPIGARVVAIYEDRTHAELLCKVDLVDFVDSEGLAVALEDFGWFLRLPDDFKFNCEVVQLALPSVATGNAQEPDMTNVMTFTPPNLKGVN